MYVYGWLTQTDPPVCRLLVAVVVAVVAAAAVAAAGLAGLAGLAATVLKIVCGAKISFLAVFGYSFLPAAGERVQGGRAFGREKKKNHHFHLFFAWRFLVSQWGIFSFVFSSFMCIVFKLCSSTLSRSPSLIWGTIV